MAETSITVRLIDETRAGFATINSNLDRIDSSASSLTKTMKGLETAALGFAAALASRQVFDFIDGIQTMENRLKLVTKSQDEFNDRFRELYDVSQRTSTPLSENIDLYSKLAQNQKVTGQTSEDLVKVTEAFSAALKISGASGNAAAGAITQFAQAMASGKFQGDEFRSVAEAAPKVLDVLSQRTGIAREELKELASKGFLNAKITSQALIEALPDLQRELDKTGKTVGQAATQMVNEFKRISQEFLETSGLSGALVKAIDHITANMENLIPIVKVVGAVLAGLAVVFAPMATAVIAVTAAVVAFADVIGPMLKPVVDAAESALGSLIKTVVGFGAAIKAVINFENPFTAFTNATQEYDAKQKETNKTVTAYNSVSKEASGVSEEMAKRMKENGLATAMAKTEYGDFINKLKESVAISQLDSKERAIATEVNKAYEAKAKDLKLSVQDLSNTQKAAIAEEVRGLVESRQANEEAAAARKKLIDESINLLKQYSDEFKKRNSQLLSDEEQYIADSKKISDAYLVYQNNQAQFSADERRRIEENYRDSVKNIQTKALDALTAEYSKYVDSNKTEEAKYKDDLLRLETAYRLALKNSTVYSQTELSKLEKDYRDNLYALNSKALNELYKEYEKYTRDTLDETQKFTNEKDRIEAAYRLALTNAETLTAEQLQSIEDKKNTAILGLQTQFQQKYKSIIDAARTTGFTDAEIYLDKLATLEKEYQAGAIKDLETYEQVKSAITKQAQQKRVDEAQAYRISEGGAETAYAANIKKLNEDLAAGLIKTDEDKNTLLRKYNKEYRDAISSEYSTLYSDLNNQILKFTGQTQEQFNRTKEIVKLVFGVDLQDLIKQFFASAIRWVIGFREGTQGEMNLVPSIIKSAFGDSSTNTISGWISGAVNLFKSFSSSVGDIFSGIGSFISNIFSSSGGLLGTISSFVGSALGILKGFGSSAASAISSTVSTVGSALGVTTAATGATTAATLTAAESGIALGGMGVGGGAAAAATGAGVIETIGAAASGVASTVGGIIAAAAPVALAVAGVYAIYKGIRSLFGGGSKNKGPNEADVYRDKVSQIQDALRNNAIGVGPGKRADGSYDYLTQQAFNGRTGERYNQPRNFNESLFYTNTAPQLNEQGTPTGANPAGGEWAKLVFYGLNQQDAMKAYLLQTEDTTYGAKGLAYSAGNLISMPTIFGTNSGMAVGGEMGTEAIMPLGRDSQGRLGVSAIGGAGNININFTINAVDSRGIDQLLVEKRSLITNIVRTAVADRGGRI